ncbi:hypothetical protein BCR32DRAFT_288729 [Anaeromyces robustus]|uniref:Uncharacterized protein n=1 Tax=Anaeromyces robustus TaxID=1754192 RepID=A0A1Y1XRT6_9FUNG|nr:hypothetical protein BCR32DRAFT_288729 [Anaeromyces robustus]|eukprot:ORX88206.1 hypothetical protein BCR32DRAFT_288729 [Anaeromyces robustus]
MNFKSLLGFTILAILNIANAVPVATISEYSKRSDNVTRSTKSLPAGYSNAYIKSKACKEKSGIPIMKTDLDNNTEYACLVKYIEGDENSEINPENSYCFLNGNDILCVDNKLSSTKYCDKSGSTYGSSDMSCLSSIYELSGEIVLDRPAVSYPSMEKFAVTPRQDQYDCKMKGGIVVTYQVIYQYMCFLPIENFENESNESLEDIYCATLNGKRYCYDDNLSRSGYCDNKKSYYNYDACKYILDIYCSNEGITLEDY